MTIKIFKRTKTFSRSEKGEKETSMKEDIISEFKVDDLNSTALLNLCSKDYRGCEFKNGGLEISNYINCIYSEDICTDEELVIRFIKE